jgi:hypothetical protein
MQVTAKVLFTIGFCGGASPFESLSTLVNFRLSPADHVPANGQEDRR